MNRLKVSSSVFMVDDKKFYIDAYYYYWYRLLMLTSLFVDYVVLTFNMGVLLCYINMKYMYRPTDI